MFLISLWVFWILLNVKVCLSDEGRCLLVMLFVIICSGVLLSGSVGVLNSWFGKKFNCIVGGRFVIRLNCLSMGGLLSSLMIVMVLNGCSVFVVLCRVDVLMILSVVLIFLR